MRDYPWLLALSLGLVLAGFWIHGRNQEHDRAVAASAQVKRWAEKLDSETSDTGVYQRPAGNELLERDPWGTPLRVRYAQGGVAEVVVVTSAGSDKSFGTPDDVERSGIALNFKGVGEGIRKNAGEVAHRSARGALHGAILGIKDGVKDAFRKDRQVN